MIVCQHCFNRWSPLNESKFKLCSKCRLVRYCSKECQSNDWQQHKMTCGTDRFSETNDFLKSPPTSELFQARINDAEAGHAASATWVGLVHAYSFTALSLEQDTALAIAYFKRAHDMGCVAGTFHLAQCFIARWSPDPSHVSLGKSLLKQAAKRGIHSDVNVRIRSSPICFSNLL